MTFGVEQHGQHRRLLVALVAAVLALVVGVGVGVDAHASTAAAQVAGTRVAAHHHLAADVVAASEDIVAGEGRRTTTLAADVAIGSRVAPRVLDVGGGTFPGRTGMNVTPPGAVSANIDLAARPSVVGSAEALPFRAGSFDQVRFNNFPAMRNGVQMPWGPISNESARVLSPGGTMSLTSGRLLDTDLLAKALERAGFRNVGADLSVPSNPRVWGEL